MNAIIYNHPRFSALKNRVKSAIEDNLIRSTVSINMSDLDMENMLPVFGGMFEDRFLNGDALLKLDVADGVATLMVDDLIANGESAPNVFIQSLKGQNLLEGMNQTSEAGEILKRIAEVRVDEGAITITPVESLEVTE